MPPSSKPRDEPGCESCSYAYRPTIDGIHQGHTIFCRRFPPVVPQPPRNIQNFAEFPRVGARNICGEYSERW